MGEQSKEILKQIFCGLVSASCVCMYISVCLHDDMQYMQYALLLNQVKKDNNNFYKEGDKFKTLCEWRVFALWVSEPTEERILTTGCFCFKEHLYFMPLMLAN